MWVVPLLVSFLFLILVIGVHMWGLGRLERRFPGIRLGDLLLLPSLESEGACEGFDVDFMLTGEPPGSLVRGGAWFRYTIFITGPFLDWGLSVVPFIINVGGMTQGKPSLPSLPSLSSPMLLPEPCRSSPSLKPSSSPSPSNTTVYDGGNIPFSTTRLSTLARAITASLQHHRAATANRVLYIHDGVVTQNLLLSFASPSSPLPRVPVSTTTLPAADPLACINHSLFSAEELCHFRRTDNKWLGLGELRAEEWGSVVREEVMRAVERFGGRVKGREEAERAVEEGKRRVLGEGMVW